MKYIYSTLLALFLLTVQTRAEFQFTIKPGTASNQVDLYIKANGAWTGKIGQIGLVYGYQTSCPNTAPTMVFTKSAAFDALFGVPFNIAFTTADRQSSGFTYRSTVMDLGIGSSNASLADQQEVLVATISFSGSSSSCPIYLLSFLDGGVSSVDYTYLNSSGTPYNGDNSPVDGSGTNYSTGASTAGTSGANVVYSATNAAVSLPITVMSFSGEKSDKRTKLNWVVTNEVNMDYYIVERSADGVNFAAIGGSVLPLGSGTINNYGAYDNSPLKGNNYYRLRLVERNGSYEYSQIVRVNFTSTGPVAVNPTINNTGIVYVQLPQGMEHATINAVTLLGQRTGFTVNTLQGLTRTVTLKNPSSGIYIIQVINDNIAENFKIFYQQK